MVSLQNSKKGELINDNYGRLSQRGQPWYYASYLVFLSLSLNLIWGSLPLQALVSLMSFFPVLSAIGLQ